jgi:hypothetical protein
VAGWEDVYNNSGTWHFRFNGPTPEALVRGREPIYFAYFWNDLAADKTRSVPKADRDAYVAAYSRPERMRAGWEYFVSWPQTAKDFAMLAQTRLNMPVLAIAGENASSIRSVFFLVEVTTDRLNRLSDLFDGGKLVSQVGTVLPLEEGRTAHLMLAGAPRKRGKILLKMASAS